MEFREKSAHRMEKLWVQIHNENKYLCTYLEKMIIIAYLLVSGPYQTRHKIVHSS